MIRAKRTLLRRRSSSVYSNDGSSLGKSVVSNGEECIHFDQPIKRIKKTFKAQSCDSISPSIDIYQDVELSEAPDRVQPSLTKMTSSIFKRNCSIHSIFLVILLLILLGYSHLSKLPILFDQSLSQSSFVHQQNYPLFIFPSQSKEPIYSMKTNLLTRYGHFIRNHFFSSLTSFITQISHIFFRIDKIESNHAITYVITSTLERFYQWFISFF